MPRSENPSFVTEIELVVTSSDAVILRKRFDAARMLYNSCLNHYLKGVRRLRDSKDYRRYKGMKSAHRRLEKELRLLERAHKQLADKAKKSNSSAGESRASLISKRAVKKKKLMQNKKR